MLTEAQRQELDRRIEEMDRDTNPGIPWEEVVNQIRNARETPNRDAHP
jgi:putative addiction module component (TIGR02574 family)